MIKIVQGVYGFLDKNGIVRPKTADDEPFSLTAEQEVRLVRLGVAEYVGNSKSEYAQDQEEAEEEQSAVEFDNLPIDVPTLTDYSVKELREIGKEYGLTFKVGISKADMIKSIEAAEAALQNDAVDEDNEPAPAFDAAEAVQ